MASSFLEAYKKRKAQLPGRILLVRYGFFYEAAFDDAVEVSKALNLSLTEMQRGEESVPMVGFPEFQLTGYVQKLRDKGYTVEVEEILSRPRSFVPTTVRTNDGK